MTVPGVNLRSADAGPVAPVDERGFAERDFRRAMGRFASGVTVVTMRRDSGALYGITVSAFMSVSLEPPLVAVSLARTARAHATLSHSERFGVSVLAADQAAVSDRFAGRLAPLQDDPFTLFAGFPVISGAVAHVVCTVHSSFEAGDHTLFVGEVVAVRTQGGAPLLHHAGGYTTLR